LCLSGSGTAGTAVVHAAASGRCLTPLARSSVGRSRCARSGPSGRSKLPRYGDRPSLDRAAWCRRSGVAEARGVPRTREFVEKVDGSRYARAVRQHRSTRRRLFRLSERAGNTRAEGHAGGTRGVRHRLSVSTQLRRAPAVPDPTHRHPSCGARPHQRCQTPAPDGCVVGFCEMRPGYRPGGFD